MYDNNFSDVIKRSSSVKKAELSNELFLIASVESWVINIFRINYKHSSKPWRCFPYKCAAKPHVHMCETKVDINYAGERRHSAPGTRNSFLLFFSSARSLENNWINFFPIVFNNCSRAWYSEIDQVCWKATGRANSVGEERERNEAEHERQSTNNWTMFNRRAYNQLQRLVSRAHTRKLFQTNRKFSSMNFWCHHEKY